MVSNQAQANWKASKREQGYRDVLVWLTPEANQALERVRGETGKSINELVSRCIVLATSTPADTARLVAGESDPALVRIEARIEAISNRLGEMEYNFRDFKDDEDFQDKQAIRERLDALEESLKPAAPAARAGDGGEKWGTSKAAIPEPEPDTPDVLVGEPVPQDQPGPAPRKRIKKRTVVDKALLLRLVADKIEADGWDFGKMEFARGLVAQGLPIYQHPEHISTWITKHHDDIVAELAKRRAAGGDA